MSVIYKYTLAVKDSQALILPAGADILCVQTQYNEPRLWARVEPSNGPEVYTIETFGTGQHIDDSIERRYIGTYQLRDGTLVFHVFVRTVTA